MQIKNSNSHKYFLNEIINLKIQIYKHFITKALISDLNNKFQSSNINF